MRKRFHRICDTGNNIKQLAANDDKVFKISTFGLTKE